MHLTNSKYVIVLFICCFIIGCSEKEANVKAQLREGDLLFQNLNCGQLCDAIEAVTDGIDGKEFSHCAIVVKINDSLKILEAIGDNVQVNTLEDFFLRSGDTAEVENITIARVKEPYQQLLPQTINFAKLRIGEPYDNEFAMDNGKWYCSELIYEAFKSANNDNDFFELNPMTFKDPETNQFFPAWKSYFEELSIEIPELQPGINPGSISRSEKLEVVLLKKSK